MCLPPGCFTHNKTIPIGILGLMNVYGILINTCWRTEKVQPNSQSSEPFGFTAQRKCFITKPLLAVMNFNILDKEVVFKKSHLFYVCFNISSTASDHVIMAEAVEMYLIEIHFFFSKWCPFKSQKQTKHSRVSRRGEFSDHRKG